MTRWFVLFSFFLAACGNSVPPDTKIDSDVDGTDSDDDDDGSDDGGGGDGGGEDGDDGGGDDDTMATPDEVDDDMDGFAEVDGDCDDTDPTVYPGAEEQPADGIDQNCDDSEVCFADADDDGLLPDGTPTLVSADGDCNDANEGTSADPVGDCDDNDATVGLPEVWYSDVDADGLGDPDESIEACEQPEGYVDNDADPCVVVDGYAGGSGTEEDPFIVCDATTLQSVDLALDAHYTQTRDIDLSDTSFTTMADVTIPEDAEEGDITIGFDGTYNGNDYAIIGLTLDETDADASAGKPTALFRLVGPNGHIHNLRFEDVDIRSANGAATVAGILMGTIEYVNVGGMIHISGNYSVGGVASFVVQGSEVIVPEISNVHVGAGNLTNIGVGVATSQESGAGGILGTAWFGHIHSSTSAINVTWERTDAALDLSASVGPAAGGAVGRATAIVINDVHTTGQIEGIHHVGGVIGQIQGSDATECTLSRSTSSGDIIGVGGRIGGVVGELSVRACNVGSMGSVSGAYWVGGVAGSNASEAHCDQCFSSADVTGIDGPLSLSSGIGGLWGYSSARGSVTNSLFTGEVSWLAGGATYAGGLLGISMVSDSEDPLGFHDSIMIGSVEPEEGGLIIGAAQSRAPLPLPGPYFTNNVFVDHQETRLPDAAHGTRSETYDLYWADQLNEAELSELDESSDTLDFDAVWTMASTVDPVSPLYGTAHPVLSWQCEHDTSILCDTLD